MSIALAVLTVILVFSIASVYRQNMLLEGSLEQVDRHVLKLKEEKIVLSSEIRALKGDALYLEQILTRSQNKIPRGYYLIKP